MSIQQTSVSSSELEVAPKTEFRVWIDQDLCTGDGLCVDVVPEVFTLLEDGIAYVREGGVVLNDPGMSESQAVVADQHQDEVVRAALICPGECIFIEHEASA